MATNNSINSSYPFATADISNSAVTYAKIQNVAASSLLGNATGSPAAPEEITLGAGLSFSGTSIVSAGSVPYTDVTGTSQTAAINNGYTANNAGLVTVTLPSTAAYGSVIEVQYKGAGGFSIVYGSGASIIYGNKTTTTSSGSLSSSAAGDFVSLRCTVANTTWSAQGSVGNLTYV